MSSWNANVTIESPHVAWYLIIIVLFVIYFTISKIFEVEMWWPWSSPLEWIKVKCYYNNRKLLPDFIFCSSRSHFYIYHHFQNIRCRNVHDFDFHLQNCSRSNVDMQIQNKYMRSYLMAIVIFILSVTISGKFIFKMCVTLTVTLTFRMGQDQMQICQLTSHT